MTLVPLCTNMLIFNGLQAAAQGVWYWCNVNMAREVFCMSLLNVYYCYHLADWLACRRLHFQMSISFCCLAALVWNRRVGGTESDVVVTQPYCHARIPRMELVLAPGKPTNWKSIWPPTK